MVAKFGGAVLRSPHDFTRLYEAVLDCLNTSKSTNNPRGRQRLLLVISAFGTTTRDLERAARTSANGSTTDTEAIVDHLAQEHLEFVRVLLGNSEAGAALELLITETTTELKTILDGIAVTKQLTKRTLDRVLAYGELLALHIARHLLSNNGVSADWADARSIVVTTDEFGTASPIESQTQVNVVNKLVAKLDSHDCVLIQGFVGATADGVVTTMGRESSTLTATFLAALLKASEVRIYTDVSGVCTADPKLFADTRIHAQLSFEQAAIAAHYGLKLLYSTTIEPAQKAGIPVRIINASAPDVGTTIGVLGKSYAPIVIVPEQTPTSESLDGEQLLESIVVVLANQAEVMSCLGALASEFSDSLSWHVHVNPSEQAVTLRLPSNTAMVIAEKIHSYLKGTLQ